MTEHVHEWHISITDFGETIEIDCDCHEVLNIEQAEAMLNAAERLSAEDARETEKEIRGASPAGDLFPKWKRRCDALRAYADTLEGK